MCTASLRQSALLNAGIETNGTERTSCPIHEVRYTLAIPWEQTDGILARVDEPSIDFGCLSKNEDIKIVCCHSTRLTTVDDIVLQRELRNSG